MSVALLPQIEASRLPRGEKAVLKAIAWFAWDAEDEAERENAAATERKTVRQIAAHAGYGRSATLAHLATLKADGAITSDGRPGDPKGCRYKVKQAWLDAMDGRRKPSYAPHGLRPGPVQIPDGLEPQPVQLSDPKSLTSKNTTREGSESARATPPDLILSGGQIVIRSQEPQRAEPTGVVDHNVDPAEAQSAHAGVVHQDVDPPPPDADPPQPERLLGNGRMDTGQGARSLARTLIDPNWRPDQAGLDLAVRMGATDLNREIRRFINRHKRGRTCADAEGWADWWESWCDKISIYGRPTQPGGGKTAKETFTPRPNGLLARLMAGEVLA